MATFARLAPSRRLAGLALVLAAAAATAAAPAPAPLGGPVPPRLLAGLVWRNVGPLRAGRVSAVSGAIGSPGIFYAGFPAAGLWKTVNAGVTWEPIFDAITTVSSIGAVAVAPSDANVIYVGTGDMITGGAINEGDGAYKSTDAGATWRHLGLDSTKQIPSILVDPHDPNLVLLAAQGNVHAKSAWRGVFRSTDGGATWTKTLFVNDSTGIERLAWAYDQPAVVFAVTVNHYLPPGPPRGFGGFGGAARNGETGTHLFKSTDEGVTWTEITGGGLPRLFGRASVAVAMNTGARRVFLIDNAGLFRSDDGGATWRQMDSTDTRIRNGQGGYNCGVYVDPQNPDIVYTVNTSSYVSTDGGDTFTGFKGAPGGDDPQQMWIDPTDGRRILLGMDQGATVSLDHGRTWSPWYNQSTEQVYHIAVDNSYPYWIYASQQDAGAIRTRSRGNFGEITPLDWSPVGTWEWGTVVADPLNPNVVYGSGSGILKITYPSEQVIDVSPNLDPGAHLRTSFSMPLVWNPWNPRELFAGFQYLMATTDGGAHWRKLSPDLGYPKGVTPPPENAPPGPPARNAPRGGAIESLSASTAARGVVWAGTSNGLVWVTKNGGTTWQAASVPGVPDSDFALVSSIDASHTDPAEAYVALDLHRLGDYAPYVYRTRDYGRTWTKIVAGLPTDQPSGSFARFVRADTKRAGLLFAGTESGMFVSFDDGDHWQPLQLNLPTTSFRDALVKDNDLVVGTYGRGIWILDDISPLREMSAATADEPAHLFTPGDAIRVRRNVNQDTPYPPEVPHALNAPDGVIVYYSLGAPPRDTIALDVLDAAGAVVRHYSSAPVTPVPEAATPPEPSFWLATPAPMPTNVGLNRVNWDLRRDAPPAFHHSFEINANPGLTPASPEGPVVPAGVYTLRLSVDGKTYTRTVTVRNDPRSPATAADVAAQYALQMKLYRGIGEAWDGYHQVAAVRGAVQDRGTMHPDTAVTAAADALVAKLDSLAGNSAPRGFRGRFGRAAAPDFVGVNGTLVRQLEALDLADMAPTPAMTGAWAGACADLKTLVTGWQGVQRGALAAFNALLAKHHGAPVAAPAAALPVPDCPPAAAGRAGARARANVAPPPDDPDNPDAAEADGP